MRNRGKTLTPNYVHPHQRIVFSEVVYVVSALRDMAYPKRPWVLACLEAQCHKPETTWSNCVSSETPMTAILRLPKTTRSYLPSRKETLRGPATPDHDAREAEASLSRDIGPDYLQGGSRGGAGTRQRRPGMVGNGKENKAYLRQDKQTPMPGNGLSDSNRCVVA